MPEASQTPSDMHNMPPFVAIGKKPSLVAGGTGAGQTEFESPDQSRTPTFAGGDQSTYGGETKSSSKDRGVKQGNHNGPFSNVAVHGSAQPSDVDIPGPLAGHFHHHHHPPHLEEWQPHTHEQGQDGLGRDKAEDKDKGSQEEGKSGKVEEDVFVEQQKVIKEKID